MKKLLLLVIVAMLLAAGCSSHSSTQQDDKFANKSCGEIVAMLQQDADQYNADNGKYPENLEKLVGKYIKAVPTCPNGGKYQIDASGKVFESY